MTKPDDKSSKPLSPVAVGVALGASAVVWLLVDVLRRVL